MFSEVRFISASDYGIQTKRRFHRFYSKREGGKEPIRNDTLFPEARFALHSASGFPLAGALLVIFEIISRAWTMRGSLSSTKPILTSRLKYEIKTLARRRTPLLQRIQPERWKEPSELKLRAENHHPSASPAFRQSPSVFGDLASTKKAFFFCVAFLCAL